MRLLIQGIILGVVIVLPGMSGGTVFLIFGLYEDIVKDILRLNIKRYIPLIAGMLGGIFASGFVFAHFFENYRDITVAFLLGCLLASTRTVIKDCPKLNKERIAIILIGVAAGFLMVAEPIGINMDTTLVSWWVLLIGGAFSSAAMIIPGLPGSSVLILLGIYDTIMFSIKNLNIINLVIFGIGSIIGIFLLLNLIAKLYEKHKAMISYFFAGLIIGSTRGLIPSAFSFWTIIMPVAGFFIVWMWSNRSLKLKENSSNI